MAVLWSSWMRNLLGGLWNPEYGQQRSGPGSYANEAGQSVNDSRAMQVSAVFRSIRIIAETAALLPMIGYKVLPNGDREPLERSHWLQQLIDYPNDWQTGDELREALVGQMAGWGNAYAFPARQSEGRIVELWPARVGLMEVERRPDRSLVYKYPDDKGVPREYGADRVLHFRAFSPDGVMGLSPLACARETLGITVGAERYAGSFFAQGGRPAGVMTADKALTDKQREQIRAEYGAMSGDNPTGKRFWLLEGSLKYQALTVNPSDMQMLETRAFQIADIARFFGVPLFLLMETEKSTSWGSGIEQQNLGFLTYTIRPYLTRLVATYNRYCIPERERGKLAVDVDEEALLLLDSQARRELFASFASNAIMTRNEIRRRLKMPRSSEANADVLTCQTALTPIANLGRLPATPMSGTPTGGAP